MATLIHADGRIEEVRPKNGKEFTLTELQGYVGGYIELVRHGKQNIFCDEDGKLKDKPVNVVASHMYPLVGDFFVGDVIVCEKGEVS